MSLCTLGHAQSTLNARYYVAPAGNDAWSGRLASPNAAKTDGPFATLQRARNALRQERASGTLNGPGTVLLRGGTYLLREPIVFEPQDSSTSQAPITYAAYPNETPLFSGGERITGWKQVGNRWETTLPEVRDGQWNFVQLWANGERRMRPRLPKSGYFFVQNALEPSPRAEGKGHDRFGFKAGDVSANWTNLEDIEFLMFQIWIMSRMRPLEINADERTVQFTGRSRTVQHYGAFRKNDRYIIENVKEALSEPGEWYLDRKSGVLSYIPMPGETLRTTIIAPRAESLVQFAGDPANKKWVQGLTLRGLHFGYTNWVTPAEGNSFSQAEAALPGAIRGVGARHITLQDCQVAHVGTYAIEFAVGSKNNRVENCELLDMAAGGIKLGEMSNTADTERLASHNTIRNNLIAHGGRVHPAAVGVWIGHSPYNKVLNNTIRDFYYTGISPGWSWGYGGSGAHHNEIAYNHISQIGQGVLSDMGGIYTLGVSTGTMIHHNLIHDIQSYDYGGWGIYFDEGTTDVVAENNVVYRTRSAGFHQHYGKNNLVRNNVFAFGGEAQLMRTRPEEHLSFTIERNIVMYNDRPLLGSNWQGDATRFKLDHNIYWNIGKLPVTLNGSSFAQWQAKGQDANSVVADPKFINWQKDDFRLQPDSPALKLGFIPIDISKAGRLNAAGTKVLYDVKKPRAFPPPPGPQPVFEDFEELPVGGQSGFNTSEENALATARVSDETASRFAPRGRKSLKFIDAPGQSKNYNPHVHFNPKYSSGLITGRFDLRVEPGATLYHEWRDGNGSLSVGPSLRVQNGELHVANKVLLTLKPSEWVRLEITCALGDAASGKWNLKVLWPGGKSQSFNDLPYSAEFRAINWCGWVADGTQDGVFYIDNIGLNAAKGR